MRKTTIFQGPLFSSRTRSQLHFTPFFNLFFIAEIYEKNKPRKRPPARIYYKKAFSKKTPKSPTGAPELPDHAFTEVKQRFLENAKNGKTGKSYFLETLLVGLGRRQGTSRQRKSSLTPTKKVIFYPSGARSRFCHIFHVFFMPGPEKSCWRLSKTLLFTKS